MRQKNGREVSVNGEIGSLGRISRMLITRIATALEVYLILPV